MGILSDLQAELLERVEANRADASKPLPTMARLIHPQALAARIAPPPPPAVVEKAPVKEPHDWAALAREARDRADDIRRRIEALTPSQRAPELDAADRLATDRRALVERAAAGLAQQAQRKRETQAAKRLRKLGL
jgi:hypothetical protein